MMGKRQVDILRKLNDQLSCENFDIDLIRQQVGKLEAHKNKLENKVCFLI